MNALHIARLELFEKRMVLIAAAILGPVLLALPYLLGFGGAKPEAVRAGVALIIASIFMLVMAIVQGASMLATDLKEGRLGFYFNRPLTATALWGGKLLGGILLITCLSLLTMAPSVLLAALKGEPVHWLDLAEAFASYLGICTAVMLGAHALSVTARARTGWIFLVVGSLGLWGLVLRLALIRLVMFSNDWSFPLLAFAALGTLGLAFACSGWLQVAQGRTELRRSAQVLALALAVGVLVSMGTVGGYAIARTRVGPEDLKQTHGGSAPVHGDWVALEGRFDLDRNRTLLFNTVTGKYLLTDWKAHDIAFSEDGTRAAWIRNTPSLRGIVHEVVWADLSQGQPAPIPTGILLGDVPPQTLNLSRDGNRLAFVEPEGRLKVHTLASGSLLASTRLPGSKAGVCFFLDPDRVRYYRVTDAGLEIGEFDLKSMRSVPTGTVSHVKSIRDLDEYAPATDRMLLGNSKEGTLYCDARSGKILATFTSRPRNEAQPNRRFLRDGSLAEAKVAGDKPCITLLDVSGQPLRTFELPAPAGHEVKGVTISAQPSATHLLVTLVSRENNQSIASPYLVDLATGAAESMNHGRPMVFDNGFGGTPRLSAQGRLFRSGQQLLRLGADGTKKALVTFREQPSAP